MIYRKFNTFHAANNTFFAYPVEKIKSAAMEVISI